MSTVDTELVDLVQRARAGEARAWEDLMYRFGGLIAAITRSFRIPARDAEDVAQTTWLRLFESIHRVREPERLGAWISTTTRRECLRVLRSAASELPTDEIERGQQSRAFAAPEHELLRTEQRAALRAAVHALPDRPRRLMNVLLASPRAPYTTVADSLDMPIGSIGPTRARALGRLRRDPRVLALAS